MAYSRRKWLKQGFWATSAVALPAPIIPLPFKDNKEFLSSDFVRLNWNENPYGPSPKVKEALVQAIAHSNHYGDAELDLLKSQIAKKYELTNKNILITSGSTEILGLLGQHVGMLEGEIIHPQPSFPTLVMFGSKCGARSVAVPLDREHLIDLTKMQNAITDQTALVFICNPNNPTSTEVDSDALRSFCKSIPSHIMVCVDEAYIQFAKMGEEASVIDLVTEHPNLIVCRTFSKAMGIAGLRIGFAASHPDNINAIRKYYTGMEFCTNILAAKAAQVALHDDEFISYVVSQNQKGRQIVYRAFDQWGVNYAESATNFIYAESKNFYSDYVAKLYTSDNIKITKWSSMKDHIRISLGTPDEMKLYVEASKKYLV